MGYRVDCTKPRLMLKREFPLLDMRQLWIVKQLCGTLRGSIHTHLAIREPSVVMATLQICWSVGEVSVARHLQQTKEKGSAA